MGEREKRRRKKEEEKKKKIQVWNFCLELLFCLEYFFWYGKYGTCVWICWLENYPNSFFVYVWVRETLTLQYMSILVGSSQFCGWF